MIASTPVARWTWGRDDDSADALVRCLRDLLAAYSVLAAHRLVIGEPKVLLTVAESGTSNSHLFRGELAAAGTQGLGEADRLAREVATGLRPGEIGAVDASADCAGMLVGETEEVPQAGLFRLGASAFAGFAGTELVTFSDAWMLYDLKGRPQPALHVANAPRLSAALRELSEVLGSETDPEDSTYFGKPTETGVDNFFDDDGTASDVWTGFEIPYRNRVFHHTPGFAAGYRRSADGEVQYVPVHGEHGVLGYRAGLLWLERLSSAHEDGLAPSRALAELAGLSAEERPGTLHLTSLRELASGN
ncbi:hypothetical protein GCM10023194_34170 [Planotetraspora phitsanulokensis]|uniref:Uncharacterized protein n=1 Tax=Planotetraspora phitsanulokensis TaxID=575192 RepID=A0A8J3XDD9_9ACTN|nr:hypothetical protein [Planotetraspora phitsanulokensis]GII36454.1 hypothetical protein Pph01_14570 [Planotetraspora phitsanulokensis]